MVFNPNGTKFYIGGYLYLWCSKLQFAWLNNYNFANWWLNKYDVNRWTWTKYCSL
jgi:hypothetical protein